MPSADQIASVLVARYGAFLTAMQLQKLLYYVQAWHVAITDEALFPEQIKAWADGPVVPQVWHSRKEPATRSASQQVADPVALDELASNLIDIVLSTYGSMSGDELSALTHTELPWCDARGDLSADAASSAPISTDAMAKFFREHRRLGGRKAADLAAGGVYLRGQGTPTEEFDIDGFLAALGPEHSDTGDDPFGSGNLEAVEPAPTGILSSRQRANLSA